MNNFKTTEATRSTKAVEAAEAAKAAKIVEAAEAAKAAKIVEAAEAGEAAKITKDVKHQTSLDLGGVVVEDPGVNKQAEKNKKAILTESIETINSKTAKFQPEAPKTYSLKRGRGQEKGAVAHLAVITKC